jgi:hypothetical protein
MVTGRKQRFGGILVTFLSAVLILGAVALITGAVVLGTFGDDSASQRSAPRGSPQSDDVVHVGRSSCDDEGSIKRARKASTPWCTLGKALESAPSGSTILVEGGRYDAASMSGDAGEDRGLRVRPAEGSGRPVLAGLTLEEASGVRISGFLFTGPVGIDRSNRVRIEDSGFASSHLYVRRSQDIDVVGNRFRDVRDGERALLVQGAVEEGQQGTENVVIRGNEFDNIAHDAIAVYNGYEHVTVEGNEIHGVWRPPGTERHSDAMQFMGGRDLTIRDNVLHDNNQGILVKDGLPTSGLVVTGNLITDGGAGLQIWNAPGARVERNSIWGTRFGTIFRNAPEPPERTSVLLRDNVLDQLIVDEGTGATISPGSRDNVFGRGRSYGDGPYQGSPNFADADGGDFRIDRSDPGAGLPGDERPPGAQRALP